jgi:Heterokaryon incompatibility protein (HET)
MSYKYRPLPEADSFRLLLITPAPTRAAHLECSLLHSTLSSCDRDIIEHYVALSYVWGGPSQTGKIQVDGYEVSITASLEAALRDLRDSRRIVRLWADALCINQSDMEERAHQVRQMGKIYATAQHTVIYLGSLTPLAESVLRAVSTRYSTGSSRTAVDQVVKVAEKDLLSRVWFTRVWVFQELLLSRDPWVQCGTLRVRWVDLCSLLISKTSSRVTPAEGQSISGLRILTQMEHAREGRVSTSLFNLLLQRRGLGATDPRDMIFAHFGIVSDRAAVDQNIKVDYQQTCRHLFEDVARYLINSAGPQLVFYHIDDIDPSSRCRDLASWAPDWRLPASPSLPMFNDNLLRVNKLNARAHYVFTQEPSVLGYLGYEIDTVASVSLPLPRQTQRTPRQRESYEQTVQKLQTLYASKGGSYMSGDEYGRHVHISLRGKEEEHEQLCLEIGEEWLSLISTDPFSPSIVPAPASSEKEFESHTSFLATFREWIRERARKGIIFVGADVNGFEELMYKHLHPNAPPSVLDGRRVAVTEGGRVGVVPAQAREGDAILYLAGSEVALTFRAATVGDGANRIDRLIRSQFLSKLDDLRSGNPYVQKFVQLIQEEKEGSIVHGRLIGECYIEGLVGWAFNETHDYSIFALY